MKALTYKRLTVQKKICLTDAVSRKTKIRYHIFIVELQENAIRNYNYLSEQQRPGNAEFEIGINISSLPSWSSAFPGYKLKDFDHKISTE